MSKSVAGKILFVDDELELKVILVEWLTSQTYETVGLTSSKEALATLSSDTSPAEGSAGGE